MAITSLPGIHWIHLMELRNDYYLPFVIDVCVSYTVGVHGGLYSKMSKCGLTANDITLA